jgi:uncharacterized BrkB/YihY/UPF0761 family membrane protein
LIGAWDFIIKFANAAAAEAEDDKIFYLGAVLWLSFLSYIAHLQVDIKEIFGVKERDILIGHLRQLPLYMFGITGVAALLLSLLEFLEIF